MIFSSNILGDRVVCPVILASIMMTSGIFCCSAPAASGKIQAALEKKAAAIYKAVAKVARPNASLAPRSDVSLSLNHARTLTGFICCP